MYCIDFHTAPPRNNSQDPFRWHQIKKMFRYQGVIVLYNKTEFRAWEFRFVVIAFFFGIGPSMLTVAISSPLMAYFFLEPFGEFTVIDGRDINLMISYVVYTMVSCAVLEWLRREQYTSRMTILVAQSRLKLLVESDQIARKK